MRAAIIPALPGYFAVGFAATGAIETVPVIGWHVADHKGDGQPCPFPVALRLTDIIGFGPLVLAPDGSVSELDGECRTWSDLRSFARSARPIRRSLRRQGVMPTNEADDFESEFEHDEATVLRLKRARRARAQDGVRASEPPCQSKRELAERLKISERRVHQIFRDKTTSLKLAQDICRLYGGFYEDYYRPPRRPGRERDLMTLFLKLAAGHYTFRAFIGEAPVADEEADFAPGDALICTLAAAYRGHKRDDFETPPEEFASLDDLYDAVADLALEERDEAAAVWRRYKAWCVGKVAAEALNGATS
jgi:hypothetical protein